MIKSLLTKHNADFSIIENKNPIYSLDDARGLFELSETAPVLIISTEKGYYALIISGDRIPIDFELIKKALRCEKVKLAARKDIFEIVGFEAGSIPLVGLKLPCVLDNRLLLYPYIYGGAGDANYTLKIDPKDLRKINEVVAIIE